VSFAAQLAAAGRADAEGLAELARLALAEGEEQCALPWLRAAAAQGGDARLWQWTGLLQRALDLHEEALDSFARAARLAPSDAGIAHGRAHVALEAGVDAAALFDAARQLGPPKSEVLIGHAAARLAAGQGEAAAAELDEILAQVPLWIEGHRRLGQIRAMLGRPDEAAASLERALAALPGEAALWRALFDLHLQREDFAALEECIARATEQAEEMRAEYGAIAAAERGEMARADALFERAPALDGLAVWRIRHLLRSGRLDEALRRIDRELASDRAAAAWPYAAAAWRLAGDPRSAWLEGDPRLVRTIDLGPEALADGALAPLLRSLHVARGEYLDQSVRGGTQTDGPLFSRIAPEIRALRSAVTHAVQNYLAQLPPIDPAHPLLRHRRDRAPRFAGSWSVRLRGGGHHANHVHPEGWISSALYIALPPRAPWEPADAGWLALGEPQAALGLDLPPVQRIEPRVGRLVLFPSWMWHGTRPFAQGERLTVAFDVAPPR